MKIPFEKVRQILTFTAVGLFNTVAYFALANALLFLGSGETIAAYTAYAALLPVSFMGHRRFTFLSEGRLDTEWIKFCVVQITNIVIIAVVTYLSGAGYFTGWLTFAIISVLIPVLNFITFQLWVFVEHGR
ncbi:MULTISPECIES: GtrA family protein [unclassified Mesorhizobium]|uniref:GtrA family protein n=1 Tax=unclassified Mesorhizobium TaxID=325217 RepID=UPI0016741B64|nr:MULTISPECIES: GtrA family protein [unclassified Mesorhizobium]